MTDQAIFYISNAFGVVGFIWAIAFIVYCVCKYKNGEVD